jgi:hypothetical protein
MGFLVQLSCERSDKHQHGSRTEDEAVVGGARRRSTGRTSTERTVPWGLNSSSRSSTPHRRGRLHTNSSRGRGRGHWRVHPLRSPPASAPRSSPRAAPFPPAHSCSSPLSSPDSPSVSDHRGSSSSPTSSSVSKSGGGGPELALGPRRAAALRVEKRATGEW